MIHFSSTQQLWSKKGVQCWLNFEAGVLSGGCDEKEVRDSGNEDIVNERGKVLDLRVKLNREESKDRRKLIHRGKKKQRKKNLENV